VGPGILDGHRPVLDGVRALSIALVLAYHGDVGWARGGFLGISTFFALSGFLVATVLLRADRDGGIRATTFWARRVRRLFPAAMAGLVLVGAYAATAASSEQVEDLPGQALAAAANVANWKFIADGTSYAARFEAPSRSSSTSWPRWPSGPCSGPAGGVGTSPLSRPAPPWPPSRGVPGCTTGGPGSTACTTAPTCGPARSSSGWRPPWRSTAPARVGSRRTAGRSAWPVPPRSWRSAC
jgi:hypothetical protein